MWSHSHPPSAIIIHVSKWNVYKVCDTARDAADARDARHPTHSNIPIKKHFVIACTRGLMHPQSFGIPVVSNHSQLH